MYKDGNGEAEGDDSCDALSYMELSDPELILHISTGLGHCAFRSQRLMDKALLAAQALEERAQVGTHKLVDDAVVTRAHVYANTFSFLFSLF